MCIYLSSNAGQTLLFIICGDMWKNYLINLKIWVTLDKEKNLDSFLISNILKHSYSQKSVLYSNLSKKQLRCSPQFLKMKYICIISKSLFSQKIIKEGRAQAGFPPLLFIFLLSTRLGLISTELFLEVLIKQYKPKDLSWILVWVVLIACLNHSKFG